MNNIIFSYFFLIFTCASGESLRFIGEYASTVSLDKSDADPLLRQQLSHISGKISRN